MSGQYHFHPTASAVSGCDNCAIYEEHVRTLELWGQRAQIAYAELEDHDKALETVALHYIQRSQDALAQISILETELDRLRELVSSQDMALSRPLNRPELHASLATAVAPAANEDRLRTELEITRSMMADLWYRQQQNEAHRSSGSSPPINFYVHGGAGGNVGSVTGGGGLLGDVGGGSVDRVSGGTGGRGSIRDAAPSVSGYGGPVSGAAAALQEHTRQTAPISSPTVQTASVISVAAPSSSLQPLNPVPAADTGGSGGAAWGGRTLQAAKPPVKSPQQLLREELERVQGRRNKNPNAKIKDLVGGGVSAGEQGKTATSTTVAIADTAVEDASATSARVAGGVEETAKVSIGGTPAASAKCESTLHISPTQASADTILPGPSPHIGTSTPNTMTQSSDMSGPPAPPPPPPLPVPCPASRPA